MRDVNEVLGDMKQMKRTIKEHRRIYIKRMMIEAARERGIMVSRNRNENCQTFEELRIQWRDWIPMKEPSLQKQFFHIAAVYFDSKKGWAEKMEEDYMREINWYMK